MKRFVAIFLIIFATYSLFSLPLSVGADLRSLDFIYEKKGVRIDAEIALDVNNIRLTIPLRYGKSNEYDLSLFETGLLVGVWPWEGMGLFAEVSLFSLGWMWGLYASSEPLFLSLEGSLGWEFRLGHIYIKPKYTVRSVYSAEDTKNEKIKMIPQFGQSRISVIIGIYFGGKDEKGISI